MVRNLNYTLSAMGRQRISKRVMTKPFTKLLSHIQTLTLLYITHLSKNIQKKYKREKVKAYTVVA